MKLLISILFLSSFSFAGGIFEFTYGLENGSFYIQDRETEADDTIDASINNFGFNFEQFFTEHQKYIIQMLSKNISYSSSEAEFSKNDLQESDVRLAWAYAAGNFQADLGIIQKSFYTYEIIDGTTVEFNSDKIKAPFLNLQYVIELFDSYFLGGELFYVPESTSENSTTFDSQILRGNLFKQLGSVRIGGYFHKKNENLTTDELLIKRNTIGYGIDIIFLF